MGGETKGLATESYDNSPCCSSQNQFTRKWRYSFLQVYTSLCSLHDHEWAKRVNWAWLYAAVEVLQPTTNRNFNLFSPSIIMSGRLCWTCSIMLAKFCANSLGHTFSFHLIIFISDIFILLLEAGLHIKYQAMKTGKDGEVVSIRISQQLL